jgi:hypothetical protein
MTTNQPKPATGEWTVDTVALMVAHGGVDMIVSAHNAALASATARELHSYDVAKKCRDELAAERERHGDEMTSVQLQLNKQLAAALAKVK